MDQPTHELPMTPAGPARIWVARYMPIAIVLVAVASFVALLPSRPSESGLAEFGSRPGSDRTTTTTVGTEPGSSPGATSTPGGSSGSADGGQSEPGTDPGTKTCLRSQVLGTNSCPPEWAGGDNGGATWTGVTGDSINLVFYRAKGNAQVQALTAGTSASEKQTAEILESYERWFNAAFQTYGRHINLIYYVGEGGDTASGAQAIAQELAEDVDAFAVVGQSLGQVLQEELARRDVLSAGLLNQYAAETYEANAPFIYGVFPDVDLLLEHVAEYYCKRLDGRPAAHAGDPTLRASQRKLGIVHTSRLPKAGSRLKSLVEACGGQVVRVVEYAPDIEVATQQWTNAMLQLKQSGATTVTCVCDPVALVFATNAADAQQYRPEYLSTGYAGVESYQAGQLYNQDQWKHFFGPGVLPRTADQEPTSSKAYLAYSWDHPSPDPQVAQHLSQIFTMLNLVINGIERAGPHLDPGTLRDALFSARIPASDPTSSALSFGPQGPSPWTAIDDLTEVWWNPSGTAANGKKGRPFYVGGGIRYSLGEWPSTDPNVFVDDGSPQGRNP